jgi:hypothetical protein
MEPKSKWQRRKRRARSAFIYQRNWVGAANAPPVWKRKIRQPIQPSPVFRLRESADTELVQKRREPRVAVNLICRMRHGDGWHDVRIRNISSRGLAAMSATPPAIGQYAELRRGSAVIVARVVWRHGHSFGMRAQDKIDASSLIDQARPAKDSKFELIDTERRKSPRADRLADTAERSRLAGSMLQYAVLGVASLAIALFASDAIRQIFSTPLTMVGNALAGSGTDLPSSTWHSGNR